MKLLIAYASIYFGFYFAFAIAFPDNILYNHMMLRFNTILTGMMGEVDLDSIAETDQKTGNNTSPFTSAFWTRTNHSANILFFLFCSLVSIVVFNILTAFAIKDVEGCLREAEINKLLKQADYINLVENSFLSR